MKRDNERFSDQIRRLIDDSGLTRYRIAVDCKIDHGLMSRFMAGTSTLSMETLDRLAGYLRWQVVAKRKQKKPTKGKAEK